ncbi:MAG: hypothetical protein R3C05_01445 [Pirellulaceae bacterium]
MLAEVKARLSEAIEKLPGSAAREVDWLLAMAKQHAVSFATGWDAEDSLQIAAINASGVLMHPDCRPTIPVHLPQQTGGFQAVNHQPEVASSVHRAIHTSAIKLAGQPALVAHNIESALIAATLAQRSVSQWIVPRCHSISLPSGISLPDLLRSVGHRVIEVGSVDGWSSASIRNEVREPADNYALITAQRVGDASDSNDLKRIKAEAGDVRHSLHVAIAAAPIELHEWITFPPPTLRELCEQTMLITSGSGLLSGPPAGLIFAAESELDTIAQSSAWSWLQAELDALVSMALAMRCWTEEPFPEASVISMLETKHANLRDRGVRLRNRLEQGGLEANVIEDGKPASLWGNGRWTLPSVQVQIRGGAESVEALHRRLLTTRPIVLANRDDDSLTLDLRWVPAELDGILARRVIGGTAENSETESDEPAALGNGSIGDDENVSQTFENGQSN